MAHNAHKTCMGIQSIKYLAREAANFNVNGQILPHLSSMCVSLCVCVVCDTHACYYPICDDASDENLCAGERETQKSTVN